MSVSRATTSNVSVWLFCVLALACGCACAFVCAFACGYAYGETVVPVGVGYVDPGVRATDAHDGDITANVATVSTVDASKIGVYTVTYNVRNSYGLDATPVVRTVRVVDTVKPVIVLKGAASVTVKRGTVWVDPGWVATDNYDGDLTAKVAVKVSGNVTSAGAVNTAKAGTAIVTYNVADASGNTAIAVKRMVVVK